jgi:DNA invertase Pin-like site-specific DNA recombinase
MTDTGSITVTYLRTATDHPTESRRSLARQQDVCEGYARTLGVQITHAYIDVGASGLSEMRPALAQLMRDLSRGGICRVVIADPARLARSWKLVDGLTKRMRRYGALLAIPKPNERND